MKIDKKVLKLGLTSIATLALYAVKTFAAERSEKPSENKTPRKKIPEKHLLDFDIDEDDVWVLDCIDEMAADIKQIENQQKEHDKRIKRLEERTDSVVDRLDNIADGK